MRKQIEPKTFKLKDEKDLGITKNHSGSIGGEIENLIPKEFENIVNKNDENIKMLNYVKLDATPTICPTVYMG